jgi:hypothetical protein
VLLTGSLFHAREALSDGQVLVAVPPLDTGSRPVVGCRRLDARCDLLQQFLNDIAGADAGDAAVCQGACGDAGAGGSIDLLLPSNRDVYWRSDGSQLWKWRAGGNPRQSLGSSPDAILGAAVNDTYVYFADGVRIRRLAR